MKIADSCTADVNVQQYVFTRVEEVLGLHPDITDPDFQVFGSHLAYLFTTNGGELIDGPFLRAIKSGSDPVAKKSASLGLACLLTQNTGKLTEFISWLSSNLAGSGSMDSKEDIIPALCIGNTIYFSLINEFDSTSWIAIVCFSIFPNLTHVLLCCTLSNIFFKKWE